MGLSTTEANKLLNSVGNATDPATVAGRTLHFSLHTADPTLLTTPFAELANSNNYSRTAVTGAFPTAAGTSRTISNTAPITLPTPSATWATATFAALWSSGTYSGGNLVASGPISAFTGQSGQPYQIPAGGLVLSVP